MSADTNPSAEEGKLTKWQKAERFRKSHEHTSIGKETKKAAMYAQKSAEAKGTAKSRDRGHGGRRRATRPRG